MKDIYQSRLASALLLLVGLWVAVTPAWISMSWGAQVSTLIVGAVVAVMSITQYFVKSAIPSWIIGIAATWLIISIFTLDMSTGAAWSAAVAAIASAILALWDGAEIEHFAHHHQAAM